jgi:hypothetical protein
VPLHTPTVPAPRHAGLARTAIIVVAACIAAGGVTIGFSDGQSAPPDRTIAETNQPATSRYFDIEANKAASMRALGLHIAEQRANRTWRYQDLEANKARSHRDR